MFQLFIMIVQNLFHFIIFQIWFLIELIFIPFLFFWTVFCLVFICFLYCSIHSNWPLACWVSTCINNSRIDIIIIININTTLVTVITISPRQQLRSTVAFIQHTYSCYKLHLLVPKILLDKTKIYSYLIK
jgi:hypothetical protein